MAYDRRIESETRIVEKEPAIDLPDIHLRHRTPEDRAHGVAHGERNIEILGEVIECPERQHPERAIGLDKDGRHGADRPIPASGDHWAGIPGGRTACQIHNLLPAARNQEMRLGTEIVERFRDARPRLGRRVRSRGVIDDDRDGRSHGRAKAFQDSPSSRIDRGSRSVLPAHDGNHLTTAGGGRARSSADRNRLASSSSVATSLDR